jgi:hypothetical protein
VIALLEAWSEATLNGYGRSRKTLPILTFAS